MKRILAVGLAVLMLMLVASCSKTPQRYSEQEAGYVQDIEKARELVRKHPIFKSGREEVRNRALEQEIEKDFEQLIQDVPGLSRLDVIFRLHAISAKLNDGHTILLPDVRIFEQYYPLHFWNVEGKLYVRSTRPEYVQVNGWMLTAVNNRDIAEVETILNRYLPKDNSYDFFNYFEFFSPELLNHAGITNGGNEAVFSFAAQSGEQLHLNIAARDSHELYQEQSMDTWVNPLDFKNWVKAGEAESLLMDKNPELDYFYEVFPEDEVIYARFRRFSLAGDPQEERDFYRELAQVAEENSQMRLILDCRGNHGGNLTPIRDCIEAVTGMPQVSRRGQFYILLDYRSFSAPVLVSSFFRKYYQPIVVGGPTSQNPLGYITFDPPAELEHLEIFFNTSNVEIQDSIYEAEYYLVDPKQRIREEINTTTTFMPDLYAQSSIEDWLAGRDKALETAWNHKAG